MKIKFELPPAAANQSNGLAVRYATAKRSVPRWRWNLLLGVVLLVPVYFLARVAIATWWASAPAVVVLEPVTVKAGAAGRVESIEAAGEHVRPGDAVAVVRPQPANDADRADRMAPARAVPVPASAPAAQLVGARAALSLARQQAELGRERLAEVEALYADAAATAGELSGARAQLLQAQAGVARAESDVEGLQAAASRAAAPARVAPRVLEARPALVSPAPAPVAGAIIRPLVRVGDLVAPGTDLLQLVPDRPPLVRAYVEPAKSRYAEVGHRATLKFFDGTRIGASVVAIEPEAARLPSERVSPLAPPTQSILVELAPDQPLPQRYRINQLPLDVRFDHLW
jgi:multidrug resistance efflux pump